MALFPGFFPEEEDGYQQSSFLPEQNMSVNPYSQDMSVTPFDFQQPVQTPMDFNIETPSIQPPAISNFLPPSLEMQGYAPGNTADIIHNAGQKYDIPDDILTGQIHQESGFDPTAIGPETRFGRAQGAMQLLPGTGEEMGGENFNPFDLQQSINAGAKYLDKQRDRFGSMDLGLAAYNAGPERVAQYGGIPPFKETQNYVKGINKYAGNMPELLPPDTMLASSTVPGSTLSDVGASTMSDSAIDELGRTGPQPVQAAMEQRVRDLMKTGVGLEQAKAQVRTDVRSGDIPTNATSKANTDEQFLNDVFKKESYFRPYSPQAGAVAASAPATPAISTEVGNVGGASVPTAGGGTRQALMSALQSQSSEFKKLGMESQKEAYAGTKLSRGDVFGAVGVPLIATLLGAAMNGKKGAKGGAVAGFQGAGLGLKVNMDEAEKKNKLAGDQAKYYFGEAKDLQQQQQTLQAQQFGADDQEAQFRRKLEEDTKLRLGENANRQAERIEAQKQRQHERILATEERQGERIAAAQQLSAEKADAKKQLTDEQTAINSAPSTIGKYIVTPTTPVIGKVREAEKALKDKLATRYEKAINDIDRLYAITAGSNTLTRSFGANANEIANLRHSLIEQLQGINSIGVTRAGGGSKWSSEQLESLVPTPDSFFSNIGGSLNPKSTTMTTQLNNLKKSIVNDMKATMSGIGFNSTAVGDVVRGPDGSSAVVMGVDADGSLLLKRQ